MKQRIIEISILELNLLIIIAWLVGILIFFLFFIAIGLSPTNTKNIPLTNNISSLYITEFYTYFERDVEFPKIDGGVSMSPTIKTGDRVICYFDFTEDELQVGNIIIFNLSKDRVEEQGYNWDELTPNARNGTIVHRIISMREEDGVKYFITRGDNEMTSDEIELIKEDVVCVIGGVIYED